jgi:hypothetical protein
MKVMSTQDFPITRERQLLKHLKGHIKAQSGKKFAAAALALTV